MQLDCQWNISFLGWYCMKHFSIWPILIGERHHQSISWRYCTRATWPDLGHTAPPMEAGMRMRHFFAMAALCTLATSLTSGCLAYCQSSICGRAIVASGGPLRGFGSFEMCSDFTTATIQIAGRTVLVTEKEL